MNVTETPYKWIIVNITNVGYKVFASWPDGWKLNSGIKSIEIYDDYYLIKGYSGSIYKCYKNSYGCTNYGTNILNSIIEKGKNLGSNIDIVDKNNLLSVIRELRIDELN